jgi:protein-tyrosine-phosphatase
MAEAICAAEAKRRLLELTVRSAGIRDFSGAPPAEAAWLTCLQNGTPTEAMGANFALDLDFSGTTRAFIMEPFQGEVLLSLLPNLSIPISLLGEFDPHQRGTTIEDPINRGIAAFESTYHRIRDCVSNYLDTTADFVGKV